MNATPPTPPTPEELWERLVLEAGEEEIEAAAAVSVEEAEAYLAAHGFDVAEERARAEAFLTELGGGGAAVQATAVVAESQARPGKVPPQRRRSRSAAVWLAAAATVAVGGAAAAYVALHDRKAPEPERAVPEPSTPAVPSDSARLTPDLVAARELRQRAAEALAAGRPDEALQRLDEARAKDPAGESRPDVVELREQATHYKPK